VTSLPGLSLSRDLHIDLLESPTSFRIAQKPKDASGFSPIPAIIRSPLEPRHDHVHCHFTRAKLTENAGAVGANGYPSLMPSLSE
jgi:hypothetical protein